MRDRKDILAQLSNGVAEAESVQQQEVITLAGMIEILLDIRELLDKKKK